MTRRYCATCRVIHDAGEDCPRAQRARPSNWRKHKGRSGYERGLSKPVRLRALRAAGFKCAVCGIAPGEGVSLQVDHVVPRSRGGTDETANLQALCAGPASNGCHRAKTQREANAARRAHGRRGQRRRP